MRGATAQRDPVTFAWRQQTQVCIRKIERFPLNIPYDMMIGRLNRIARDLVDPRHITVLVDATGCSQPFVDKTRLALMGWSHGAMSVLWALRPGFLWSPRANR